MGAWLVAAAILASVCWLVATAPGEIIRLLLAVCWAVMALMAGGSVIYSVGSLLLSQTLDGPIEAGHALGDPLLDRAHFLARRAGLDQG